MSNSILGTAFQASGILVCNLLKCLFQKPSSVATINIVNRTLGSTVSGSELGLGP